MSSEQEAKFVQDRIVSVERTIAGLSQVFAQYSRKSARLRDKGDEMSGILTNYAETEDINKSLSVGLENFASCMTTLSGYGDKRVQNLDGKVVQEFSRYEEICKHVKEEVKQIYNAREKELGKRRYLDRIRERNPRNRQQIIQAETELVKATAEVAKTVHNLEEKTNEFEKQKLHDIKSILLDFVSIEMGYHAKALEVLTDAYKTIETVDEESDLEEFKKSLRLPDTVRHSKPGLFRGHSLSSFGSIFNRKQDGIPDASKFKSEETLDSMKHSFSETEESASDSEDLTETDRTSPIVVRKYKK